MRGNFLVFVLFIFIITILLPSVLAGSLGMSPSMFKFNFRPFLDETVSIRVATSDMQNNISIAVLGDLTQYVNLSTSKLKGMGEVTVKIKLPKELDRPGKHRILIQARELVEERGSGVIGGVSAIQVPIDIFVPYPGKYAEAEFEINNINENESIPYKLTIFNFGTEAINISSAISIFSDFDNVSSLINSYNNLFLKPNEKVIINDVLSDHNLKPGNYVGFARLNYGPEIILNSSFKVGTFSVNLTDYDYQFIAGKISPIKFKVKSLWNSDIKDFNIEISITNLGEVKSSFKSSEYSFGPMEEKVITGYLDGGNLTAGRYTGNILLSYDGKTTTKLVALYFNEPELSKTEKLLYASGGVMLLFVIIILYLMIKLHLVGKRINKNESK